MPEDINVLINQCEQRSRVLSQETDRAAEEVSQIMQFATTLAATLGAASQEALGSFEALNGELQTAEQNLDSELASAREGLSSLQEKTGQLQTQTEEKLDQIENQLAELENRKEEILTEVNQESETAKASFDKLSQQAQDFESEADAWEDSATNNIEALRDSVDTARNSFNQHQTDLIGQFDTLEQDIGQRLEALMSDFSTLMDENTNQLIAIDNALNTATSDAITAMNQKFEEALGEISSEAEQVCEALYTLAETGANDNERLDESFAELINGIADVFVKIQEIRPVLDEIEETLK